MLPHAQLAAKCETRQSLFNIQAIAAQADCLIMSRGNLGLDVLPEKMALVQKAMINNANLIGKPVGALGLGTPVLFSKKRFSRKGKEKRRMVTQ